MRRRFNLNLEKDYKLRPTGLEGPNQNKFQEVVFQALETARDRREHLQWSNSKKYGCSVQGCYVEDETGREFASHIRKFRLSFRDSRNPWKILKEAPT